MDFQTQIELCGSDFRLKIIPDDLPEEEYCHYLSQALHPYNMRKYVYGDELTELEEKERMNIMMRSWLAHEIYRVATKDKWNWRHYAYRNMIRSDADLEALLFACGSKLDNMFR